MRSRTEKRVNFAAELISAAVIIGLCADLVDYAFASESPQHGWRFYWLVLSAALTATIVAWMLFAGKRAKKARPMSRVRRGGKRI